MAIKFTNKPVAKSTPPVVQEYTILTALAEWHDKKFSEGTLMLVHRTEGTAYQVMGYDVETHRVKLKGNHGEILNPAVTEREVKNWYPLWRQ